MTEDRFESLENSLRLSVLPYCSFVWKRNFESLMINLVEEFKYAKTNLEIILSQSKGPVVKNGKNREEVDSTRSGSTCTGRITA